MAPFCLLAYCAGLAGEDERLGHMRRASLTNMDAWGAFPALRWREMPVVARRMCHNREFSSHMAHIGAIWPGIRATNASLRQPLLLHAPQTQVFASCSRRMCHKWIFPSVAPSTRATNEAPRRLSMPSTKYLRHGRAVCAPHIEVGTPLAAFNPEKPCGGGAVAGTIRSGKYIVKR